YLLSSTFVPVVSAWLLRGQDRSEVRQRWFSFASLRNAYAWLLRRAMAVRWVLVPAYLGATVVLVVLVGGLLGMEIFPQVDAGQFQLRIRAPEGTPLERTEQLTKEVLQAIADEAGPENVAKTVSLVGTASYNYPINSIYLWTSGPHEALLKVAL